MVIKNARSLFLAAVIILADQLTKGAARAFLTHSIPVIQGVVYFTLVKNTGAGFGLFQGQRVVLIIFSILVMAWIAWKWQTLPASVWVPLGLILGGIIGNLIDRIYFGTVTDFIDFRVWPVFNVADSAITIGVAWLILQGWKGKP